MLHRQVTVAVLSLGSLLATSGCETEAVQPKPAAVSAALSVADTPVAPADPYLQKTVLHTSLGTQDVAGVLQKTLESFGYGATNEGGTYFKRDFYASSSWNQSGSADFVASSVWQNDGDTEVSIKSKLEPKQFDYVIKRLKEKLPTTQPTTPPAP